MIKKLYNDYQEFWLYSLGGALGAVVDFGLLYFLTEYVGLWYLTSATISVFCAMIVNYSWQRRMTFKSSEKNIAKQFSKYVVISIMAIGINLALLYVLVDVFDMWYIIAKVFVTVVVWFWNFFGNKYFTFAKTQGTMQL